MNKIQEVKERVDIVRVAEYFGIKKKQCCPFHNERTPSFSISQSKQIFHCFGCGVGGDCITLVSKLLNINAYESAKQLNNIFNLNVEFEGKTSKIEINKYKQKQLAKQRFKEWEEKTFILLCSYYQNLKGIEKYKEQEKVEYFIDIFISGTEEDKLWFKQTEERWCKEIARRMGNKNTRRKSAI